jgi:hypothetical protein
MDDKIAVIPAIFYFGMFDHINDGPHNLGDYRCFSSSSRLKPNRKRLEERVELLTTY